MRAVALKSFGDSGQNTERGYAIRGVGLDMDDVMDRYQFKWVWIMDGDENLSNFYRVRSAEVFWQSLNE